MFHGDDHPHGNAESSTAATAGTSNSTDASIDNRVTACEKLVDDAVEKDIPATVLADSLKELGLKAIEAVDYLDEFNQRIAIRRSKARVPGSPPHEHDEHSAEHTAEASSHARVQEDRDRAVEEAAWASLRSKLEVAAPALSSGLPSSVLDKMFELFGQEALSSTTLSKSVLAVAPHLADDEDTILGDPYLCETQKCKVAYASQKPFDYLIVKAQARRMPEPIANSIWRLIILDKYVDFEKLYVTLDPDYNPNDEAKDLGDSFTLLEKNSVSSKRSVFTEAEWMRLYDIWVCGVLHFYPHRRSELSSYRELIVTMFRATSSAIPAIRYDRDSRERYSRQPYRLDSSKDVLPLPLLSQLLSQVVAPASSSSGGKRRSSNSQEGPRKRSETICRNWNLGNCEVDPCHYSRRHNECCECGGSHRAKDRGDCLAALNQRRQQQKAATAARSSRT
jgi:hypothetical protein